MKRLAFLSLVIFLAHVSVFAQQAANATLTGAITDQNGALVPDVKITATHTATGAIRETITNSDGIYVFSNMSPGDYELRIEAKGFSTKVTKTPVPLKVGQTLTMNVPLQIDVNESVVVDPTKTNTVVISSAGQLGRGGNVIIDGVDTNDDVVGGSIQNISQEAIREFQIATNRFSAQRGRYCSSVINVLTKSGGNELHGSGSFY